MFEGADLAQYPGDLVLVLALQLVEHGIAVLALPVWRGGPVAEAVSLAVAAVGVGRCVPGVVGVGTVPARSVVAARVAFEEGGAGVALVEGRRAEPGMPVSLLVFCGGSWFGFLLCG